MSISTPSYEICEGRIHVCLFTAFSSAPDIFTAYLQRIYCLFTAFSSALNIVLRA